MAGKAPNRPKGTIVPPTGQSAQEMMPPSSHTGHPLNGRVHRPGTVGK